MAPVVERRQKPRVDRPYVAKVRGKDANGRAFQADTLLDNLSASGLYLRVPFQVETGARLFILIGLLTSTPDESSGGRVAVRGVVLRAEPREFGLWGLALKIISHRFLVKNGAYPNDEVRND
jgi:hypothetical protein